MARASDKKKSSSRPRSRAARSRTYSGSGVDIGAGEELVKFLRRANPAIGGFSGLAALPKDLRNPRLLMATDGAGTKLLVAQLAGRHRTIGVDLVAMVVNDLIACGGRPLFFLDYFATGKLEPGVAREVMGGIMRGCREADCKLVGGETAEMPGMYAPGHYDLAGFGVGVVEAGRVIDGTQVADGDILLGFASSGLHSNGYSLARAALLPETPRAARRALERPLRGTKTPLGRTLLQPTRIYVRTILKLISRYRISAMAHVTGGGIAGNLVRVLPLGLRACVRLGSWPIPRIFGEIARRGPVDPEEMMKVFNMGIGYIIVAPPDAAEKILARCRRMRERCRPIGWVTRGAGPKSKPEVLILE